MDSEIAEEEKPKKYDERLKEIMAKFNRDYNLALAKKDRADMRYIRSEYLHEIIELNNEYGYL